MRVLKFAQKAGVKRIVLTSSFAAVGYSIDLKNHIFTEEYWTDVNLPLPAYIKSKTVAEKAAWDFIKNSTAELELTVINQAGIMPHNSLNLQQDCTNEHCVWQSTPFGCFYTACCK